MQRNLILCRKGEFNYACIIDLIIINRLNNNNNNNSLLLLSLWHVCILLYKLIEICRTVLRIWVQWGGTCLIVPNNHRC